MHAEKAHFAGIFDQKQGSIIFADASNDPIWAQAFQYHETAHEVLATTTKFGSLQKYLLHFRSCTYDQQLQHLLDSLHNSLQEAQRPVQEGIATFYMLTFLIGMDIIQPTDVKSLLNRMYYEYIKPLLPYLNTVTSRSDELAAGVLNLGAACLNSPIIDRFTDSTTASLSVFHDIIADASISPTIRLTSIIKLFSVFGYKIYEFVPEAKMPAMVHLLNEQGVPTTFSPSKERSEREFSLLLRSSLFMMDGIAANNFKKMTTFHDNGGQFMDLLANSQIYLRRTKNPILVGMDQFAEFYEEILGLAVKNENITPIIEIRSEDIYYNERREVSRLDKGSYFINFIPIPGDLEKAYTTIIALSDLKTLLYEGISQNFRILMASHRYNLKNAHFVGLEKSLTHSVIIPLGSVALAEKLSAQLKGNEKIRNGFFLVESDQAGKLYLVVYREADLPIYVIMPCTENTADDMCRTLESSAMFLHENPMEQTGPNKYLGPIFYHLDRCGWMAENIAINEDLNLFVPSQSELQFWI